MSGATETRWVVRYGEHEYITDDKDKAIGFLSEVRSYGYTAAAMFEVVRTELPE